MNTYLQRSIMDMTLLPKAELQQLIQPSGEWCISIFMPIYRAGSEIQQNPIRLKNLLAQASEALLAQGLRSPEAEQLLAPIQALQQDGSFWRGQGDGLALFAAPNFFRYYFFPCQFEESVVVNARFYLKPLLPLLSGDGRFYILALSQSAVQLWQGTRSGIITVDLPDAPTSLAEALKYDDLEKQLQFHTGTAPRPGHRAAVFHGQGMGRDDEKEGLKRYLRQVAAGVQRLLRDEHAPLLLAGVNYLLPIYRKVNDYPYLIEEGIFGNPEAFSDKHLHERAWAIVEPYFLKAQEEALAQYHHLAHTRRTSQDLRVIVPAAHYGRVETLFVTTDRSLWGALDPQTNTIALRSDPKPGDEDLLDAAAVQALLRGGTVYALAPEQMPEESLLAAVFRYW
jgi:hypothetical protein